MVKKDCFAYSPRQCRILIQKICEHRACGFYKTQQQYREDLKKYPPDSKDTGKTLNGGKIMQEKNKEIRFIDSDYNELFRIKDGEYITVTTPNGVTERRCKYIDEYHTQIGYNTFHICEFAELMERGSSTYRPKDVPAYTLENISQEEFAFMFGAAKWK